MEGVLGDEAFRLLLKIVLNSLFDMVVGDGLRGYEYKSWRQGVSLDAGKHFYCRELLSPKQARRNNMRHIVGKEPLQGCEPGIYTASSVL